MFSNWPALMFSLGCCRVSALQNISRSKSFALQNFSVAKGLPGEQRRENLLFGNPYIVLYSFGRLFLFLFDDFHCRFVIWAGEQPRGELLQSFSAAKHIA